MGDAQVENIDEHLEQHKILQEKNVDKLKLMAANDIGVDAGSVTTSRLNFFIEWLLGKDTKNRLNFEIDWETNLAKMLENLNNEVNKAKLLENIKSNGGQ